MVDLKAGVVVALLLLSGCSSTSSSSTPSVAATYSVPTTCELPKILAAFDAQVTGSKYIKTDWQPDKGTDLYDVLKAGGIACTYGIQVAEIGGTVLLSPISNSAWEKKKTAWLSSGQILIDLAGIDESSATILKEGSTSADEMHVWGVNLLYKGIWIQVNASFLQTTQEALPIIQAAIDSLITQ